MSVRVDLVLPARGALHVRDDRPWRSTTPQGRSQPPALKSFTGRSRARVPHPGAGSRPAKGTKILALGGPKQRALLAILLLNANQPVSVDRLIDELWARSAGQRRAERRGVRVAAPQGSRRRRSDRDAAAGLPAPGGARADRPAPLRAPGGGGASRFAAGDAEHGAARLRSALALWRRRAARRLRVRAVRAGGDRPARGAAARGARGPDRRRPRARPPRGADRRARGAGRASTRCASGSRGQLMLALYRAGRQAEALEVYRRHARRTRGGTRHRARARPSRSLERAILDQDPALEPGPADGPRQRSRRDGHAVRSSSRARDADTARGGCSRSPTPLARSASPHELIVVSLLPGSRAAALAEATRRHARPGARNCSTRALPFASPRSRSDDLGSGCRAPCDSQQDVDLLLVDARRCAVAGPLRPPADHRCSRTLPATSALLVAGDPVRRETPGAAGASCRSAERMTTGARSS